MSSKIMGRTASSSSLSEASFDGGSSTYEATKARQSIQSQPDKIHWEHAAAFRDHPYRLLHHQRGLIGVVRIRLLEATDLKRSYWSPLALGPVKHLGLSKAHGQVSSFCAFHLGFAPSDPEAATYATATSVGFNKKPAAKPKDVPPTRVLKSPVVPANDNPVWENCQFEFPLRKGAMPSDGMRVHIHVSVEEDGTAMEHFLPGVSSQRTRMLGLGSLDVTELCLGETASGQLLPGVQDAWIPISLKGQEIPDLDRSNRDDPLAQPVTKPVPSTATGVLRVLVSYTPLGLDPQPKDIIALEAFARRNPLTSSCRPLIPPLMPMTVLERRGQYLLAEYVASDQRKACVRLHRNAVFVVERQNLVDAAHNLALLPADVWMSTPVGRKMGEIAGPVVAASRELLLPAFYSFKLVWVAVRTTTLASMSGVRALGSTLWQEGSSSLIVGQQQSRDSYREHEQRERKVATAQFVHL